MIDNRNWRVLEVISIAGLHSGRIADLPYMDRIIGKGLITVVI